MSLVNIGRPTRPNFVAANEGAAKPAIPATLTGAPFYLRRGFYEVRQFDTPLPNGEGMRLIAMEKKLPAVPQGASKNASMV